MKHITSLLLLISGISLGQFNKVQTDPLKENPTFTGSEQKARYSAKYTVQQMISKQLISFDAPLKKDFAIGFRGTHNDLFDSREVDFTPTLSFRKENHKTSRTCKRPDHFVFWSGGISTTLNYLYKRENHFFFSNKMEGFSATTDHTSLVGNYAINGDSLYLVTPTDKRLLFRTQIGLSRTTDITLQETSFLYDPIAQFFEHKLSVYFSLNENKKNKLSSTLGFSHHFIKSGSEEIVEGYEYNTGGLSVRRVTPDQIELLGVSFWASYGSFVLGLDLKQEVYTKYKTYNGEFTSREVGDYTSENKNVFSLGIKREKMNLLAQYTYGFAQFNIGHTYGEIVDNGSQGAEQHGTSTNAPSIYKELSFSAIFVLDHSKSKPKW